ncbi:hypothetical protein PR202_ga22717 [Eleusine coracana subsp. coracana]|uniref:Calmodulin-binding protein n=1 Tax=Eleusine coracana subsp. coracana TaxID=191504 RepID=A0AAV5D4R1_ELECO|nr:hypothetical protein QOZ80_9AG0692290 [Eleusine coracana subsp. coracana]GJN05112.1 hypothetical protein PR202_ga22717 [Eleusine coracana subsp. coracana]
MATTATADAEPGATPGDPFFSGSIGPGCDSECSTPFVSAPSSPTRDHHHHNLLPYHHHHGACFFSAPASPTRSSGESGGGLDFDFDFSSRFPSPSAAAMSSADELFCNGQIRLAAALLQPQQPATDTLSSSEAGAEEEMEAVSDERGRVRRKARSMSPFRSHWRRSPSPAAADEPASAVPAASRSSSSSSTASSASSSSSSSSRQGSRRWGFFKDLLLHRSKSDGGKTHHHSRHLPPPAAASPKPAASHSPSPAGRTRGPGTAARSTTTGRSGRRRSAHERLYEARRAEAEEMRRRTYLPYRQGVLLFGCIGIGSRVHGLARGFNAAVSSRS